jgi:hypothetical protein
MRVTGLKSPNPVSRGLSALLSSSRGKGGLSDAFCPTILWHHLCGGEPIRSGIEFILICGGLIGPGLLLYCVRLLKRIDRTTAAVRFLLFRDYEQDLSERGVRPLMDPPQKAATRASSIGRH